MMGVWLILLLRKEVQSLGSRAEVSNGSDALEMIELLAAFEMQNTCKLTLTCSLEQRKGSLDAKWVCQAQSTSSRDAGLPSLDLGSVSVWVGDYKTLTGVLTRLLYAMDFHLALQEYASASNKKA